MGFLNRLFGSIEVVARDLEEENNKLVSLWEQYVRTVAEKKNLADNLPLDTVRLRELVNLELEEISLDENAGIRVIKDLKSIKLDRRIARIHRLSHALDYAETKYIYIYKLLEQIYSILKTQLYLLGALEKEKNNRKLAKNFQDQIKLEQLILEKIRRLNQREGPNTFKGIFLALIRGEVTIRKLDAIAQRHFKKMQRIFSNEIPESITYQWVEKVVSSIENKIHEAVADGLIPHYHQDIAFEVINRPMFVDLVRESIESLKPGKKVSERMIAIFVEDFRQGFNEKGLN